jgi:WD40 repeat protein
MRVLSEESMRRSVHALAFSGDGARLVSASFDGSARVWDLPAGKVVQRLRIAETLRLGMTRVALTPDGQHVVAVGRAAPAMAAWDAATGKAAQTWRNSPLWFDFDPADGRLVVLAGSGTRLEWWQVGQAKPGRAVSLASLKARFSRFFFLGGGDRVALLGGLEVVVYDLSAGRRAARLCCTDRRSWDPQCRVFPFAPDRSTTVVFAASPDGRWVVSGSDRDVAALRGDTLAIVAELREGRKHIQGGAFTPDGRRFCTVSNEATVKEWDPETWQVRQQWAWKAGPLKCVAFSPDGMLGAAGSGTGKIVVWDVDE